jgi:hypothetical protein
MGGHSKGAHRETMRDGQAQDKRFRPLWHTITVCEVCGAKPGLIGKKDPRIGPDGARWQPSMYGTIPSFHLQRCGHCLDAKQTEVPSAGVRPTKKWQLEVHDDGDVWLSAEKMQIEHVRESQFAKRPHDINTLWRAAVFSIMSLHMCRHAYAYVMLCYLGDLCLVEGSLYKLACRGLCSYGRGLRSHSLSRMGIHDGVLIQHR